MLILSKEHLYSSLPNMITLQCDNGSFILANRNFYDAALILSDKYANRYDAYALEVGGNQNLPAIKEFYETAPEPINFLAPFLGLINVDKANALSGDFEAQVGALCVIGMQLDMRNLLRMRREIRQSVNFSMSITEEYKKMWEQFESSCFKFSEIGTHPSYASPTSISPSNSEVTTYEEEDDEEEDNEPFPDFIDVDTGEDIDYSTPSTQSTNPSPSSQPEDDINSKVLDYINGGL